MKRLLLGFVALTALGCHQVNEDDAKKALSQLEWEVRAPDKSKRQSELYGLCGMLDSCAAGCAPALAANIDESQRGRQIAGCFKDFVKAKEADRKLEVDAWFNGYLADYLVRAREKLKPDEQARFDAARAKLGLMK
jgi:hypothetical protein